MKSTPIIVYRGKPQGNSWARWFISRTMRKNQNNLVSVVGRTGSGKTLSAISICEMMSKMSGVSFTIDNIVFSLKELMDLINSDKLKKGSAVIFDEPQISISAREFQSQANRVFNYLLSTFRHRNLSLFFCTPFENLLDKSTRKLFHCRLETMSINQKNQTCRLKPRYIEYSDFKEQPYRKQLIVFYKDKNGNNKSQKLFFWDVPRPSKELEEQYEKKKLDFTTRLNKNISERLRKFDEAGNSMTAEPKKEKDIRKPLTEIQKEAMKVYANIKEGNKFERASKILHKSMSSISENVKSAQKKGYTLEEFRENV
jgi:ABC-type oligopeptide transport system ATPase subunit